VLLVPRTCKITSRSCDQSIHDERNSASPSFGALVAETILVSESQFLSGAEMKYVRLIAYVRQDRDAYNTARIALFLLLILSFLSLLKGFVLDVRLDEAVYFVINYKSGLIRRGLLGHIFSLFLDQTDLNRVRWAALCLHLAACMLLLLGLWVWLRVLLNRGSDGLLVAIFAVFATSQFLPTQAYDTGFLDIYDYLLVLAASAAILCDLYVLAGVIGFIGPFIHEGFIFVWLALTVLVVWEGQTAKRIAVLITPLIATAIVYFVPTEQAGIAQMATSSLPQGIIKRAIAYRFGQTLSSSLQILFWKYRYNFANFMLAAAFFEFPVVIIVFAYGVARKNLRDVLALTVAAFIPATILLVGWDLSRFLVGTTFSALLAVLYMQSVRPTLSARWALTLGCSGVATLGLLIPFIYAHFEVAAVIDRGFIPFANTPIGKFVTSSVSFYSRNIGPRVVPEVGTERPPGTVWYEEEDAWKSVWTRRPGTNIFDAVASKGGLTVRCVLTISRGGDRVRVVRTDCSDGNDLMYAGTINGLEVQGTYPGGKWHATIIK
jgi:hypothetical protein